MIQATRAGFLLPTGYARPAVAAVLRELGVVGEASRYAVHRAGARRSRRATPYALRAPARHGEPVLLVPGFLAGDLTLRLMSAALREQGFRTYRAHIHANVTCTQAAAAQLEERIEEIAERRGSRVQVVGHSLGGMLARGVAARRPDLVAGVVTLGSPVLAPGAHHHVLSAALGVVVRLSSAGLPNLMSGDCVGGDCARQSVADCQAPMPPDVAFTTVYSKRDGIVDWRACLDPAAEAVEVSASHLGMAVDPRVLAVVADALARRTPSASAATIRIA